MSGKKSFPADKLSEPELSIQATFNSSADVNFGTRNFEFKPEVSELEVSILRKGSTFPEDPISPTKRTFRSTKHRARYYASIPNTISHPRKQIRGYSLPNIRGISLDHRANRRIQWSTISNLFYIGAQTEARSRAT